MSVTFMNKRREEGFTLVEIMIVIAIIGLISGIVAVSVLRESGKAKGEKVSADGRRFDDAATLFYRDCGQFPQDLMDLISNPGMDGWDGPYIKGGPKALKDPWNRDYLFELTGSGDPPFRIGSLGADGAVGGDGENADVWYPEEGQ